MFGFSSKPEKKSEGVSFYDLFVQNASNFNRGAILLHDVIKDPSSSFDHMEEIERIEKHADEVTRQTIEKLYSTFITPIDRDDIFRIETMLDTAVDLLQGALQRIVVFRAGNAPDKTEKLAEFLMICTELLVQVFDLLPELRKNFDTIVKLVDRITHLENEADHVFRDAMALLYDDAEHAPESEMNRQTIYLIKWKGILENVENSIDYCSGIANTIRGLALKYT